MIRVSIANYLRKHEQKLDTLETRARQRLVDRLLRNLHLRGVSFGNESITLSPTGAGDVIRWSAAHDPASAGDLGMAADGHPRAFVGSAKNCLVEGDAGVGVGSALYSTIPTVAAVTTRNLAGPGGVGTTSIANRTAGGLYMIVPSTDAAHWAAALLALGSTADQTIFFQSYTNWFNNFTLGGSVGVYDATATPVFLGFTQSITGQQKAIAGSFAAGDSTGTMAYVGNGRDPMPPGSSWYTAVTWETGTKIANIFQSPTGETNDNNAWNFMYGQALTSQIAGMWFGAYKDAGGSPAKLTSCWRSYEVHAGILLTP